jgi:hypothetical protein
VINTREIRVDAAAQLQVSRQGLEMLGQIEVNTRKISRVVDLLEAGAGALRSNGLY